MSTTTANAAITRPHRGAPGGRVDQHTSADDASLIVCLSKRVPREGNGTGRPYWRRVKDLRQILPRLRQSGPGHRPNNPSAVLSLCVEYGVRSEASIPGADSEVRGKT